MALYVQLADGRRLPFDTKKIEATFEGEPIDFTGARFDFYEAMWVVADGSVGNAEMPCKIFRVSDPFTGVAVEVPFERPRDVGKKFLEGISRLRLPVRLRRSPGMNGDGLGVVS